MLISVRMDSTTKENCSENKPVPEKNKELSIKSG